MDYDYPLLTPETIAKLEKPEPVHKQRERMWGDSWKLMSMLHNILYENRSLVRLVGDGFAFHPWYMILVKLIRLTQQPRDLDSWRDIVGYASLMIDLLTPEEEGNG